MTLALALALAFPPHDAWFGADKVKHFFMSAFVQSVSYSGFRLAGAGHGASLLGASGTTAVLGIGKELHDGRAGGRVSARDLVWDAAGAGAATLILDRSTR